MIFLPKKLNYDRLEQAASAIQTGGVRDHRQGITVAYLYLMLGEIELGDPSNNYQYLSETRRHTNSVAKAFVKLILEYYPNHAVQATTNCVTVYREEKHVQQFYFDSVESYKTSLPHKSLHRIFADISDETMHQMNYNIGYTQLWDTMKVCLDSNQGDIV